MADSGNLASLLFGKYRRDTLALLLLRPEQSLHVREVARITGKVPGTLLRELNRLADAGLLLRRRSGNQVHFQANSACPIYEELRSILKKTSGLADVLHDALEPLSGKIPVAFVYGSIARGTDTASSDVDLMVVSDELTYPDIMGVLVEPERILARAVKPTIYKAEEFRRKRAPKDAFLRRVLEQPKLFVIGSADDLPAA